MAEARAASSGLNESAIIYSAARVTYIYNRAGFSLKDQRSQSAEAAQQRPQSR